MNTRKVKEKLEESFVGRLNRIENRHFWAYTTMNTSALIAGNEAQWWVSYNLYDAAFYDSFIDLVRKRKYTSDR